jgi:hypothetical protein
MSGYVCDGGVWLYTLWMVWLGGGGALVCLGGLFQCQIYWGGMGGWFGSVWAQSTYILRVPQCMSPRRNWDSPNPSLASECAPPPRTGGEGAHSPAGEGLGKSRFRRLEKKLSTLPTLCVGVFFSSSSIFTASLA